MQITRSPYDAYTIGYDQRGLIDTIKKVGIVLRGHHKLRVYRDDLLARLLIALIALKQMLNICEHLLW